MVPDYNSVSFVRCLTIMVLRSMLLMTSKLLEHNTPVDIFCVTETWGNINYPDGYFSIEGYSVNIHHRSYLDGRRQRKCKERWRYSLLC